MATIVNSKGKSFIKLTPVSRRDIKTVSLFNTFMLKIIIVRFEVIKLHVHLCKRMNCIYLYCYLNGKFFSKGMRFIYQSHNIKSLKETSLGSDLTAVSNQSYEQYISLVLLHS